MHHIWDLSYLSYWPSTKYINVNVFTQALEGLESFITMIGHRFPKFYNASLYATFLKSNFWEQKSRMLYKVVSVQIYSDFISGLFWMKDVRRYKSKIYIMPIPRIANFHWAWIMFGIEILFSYAYARLSGGHVKIWKLRYWTEKCLIICEVANSAKTQ
jgi:hypothetical protein